MVNLTIIQTIYNEEIDILKKSINSVKQQRDKNFNYIIVFNGTNEYKYNQIIKYLKNNRIKVYKKIYLKKNIGYGSARNLGINSCNSTYFSFLDADDTLSPFYTEKINNKIISSKEFDVLFISFNVYDYENKKQDFTFKQNIKNESKICRDNNYLWYPAGWTKVINKNFWLANKILYIPDKENLYEDLYVHLNILFFMQRWYFLDEKIYNYFVYKNSTINNILKEGKMKLVWGNNFILFWERNKPKLHLLIKWCLSLNKKTLFWNIDLIKKLRINIFKKIYGLILIVYFYVLYNFLKDW